MNIHIIQLPHTFPYLVNLSLPFKKYGFDTITLVANGFDIEQIKELTEFTRKYDYIKILDIPTKRILSHGQALNYAFENSSDELFCFADHDIFPTQSLKNEIKEALEYNDVICLGDRPENTIANYKGFAASATQTQSGIPLVTSFFSIYKRSVVELAKTFHKVGFEQYFRKSQIPKSLNNQPDIEELREPFLIDTCKAQSLALFQLNKSIFHLGTKKVCHLGGLCGAINRYTNNGFPTVKDFIITKMPTTNELENFYLNNQKRHPKVLELKRAISDFSLQLLIALQQGSELPNFKCNDSYLEKNISKIVMDVTNNIILKN